MLSITEITLRRLYQNLASPRLLRANPELGKIAIASQKLSFEAFYEKMKTQSADELKKIFGYSFFEVEEELLQQQKTEEGFNKYLEGKRVCLVGPSDHLTGKGLGSTIDSFDVVVRLNFQWPLAQQLQKDFGKKLDVLYHCCNGDFPVDDLFLPEFSTVKFVCWEAGSEGLKLHNYCSIKAIPSLCISETISSLERSLETPPNTGTSAIYHLLSSNLSELHLFGISFHLDNYVEGYRGRGAELGNWKHDLKKQLDWFTGILENENRIKLESNFLALLEKSS